MFYAPQKLALASILQVGSHRQRHQDPKRIRLELIVIQRPGQENFTGKPSILHAHE